MESFFSENEDLSMQTKCQPIYCNRKFSFQDKKNIKRIWGKCFLLCLINMMLLAWIKTQNLLLQLLMYSWELLLLGFVFSLSFLPPFPIKCLSQQREEEKLKNRIAFQGNLSGAKLHSHKWETRFKIFLYANNNWQTTYRQQFKQQHHIWWHL